MVWTYKTPASVAQEGRTRAKRIMRLDFLLLTLQMLLLNSGQLYSKSIERASSQEILQAMQSQAGYEPTVSTNVARFQAAVLLDLAEKAMASDSAGTVLFIGHQEWFDAYLRLTGLTESTVPVFARLAYRYKQDQLLDFRKDLVVEIIEQGKVPLMAINVIVGWPESADLPGKYSFADTLSTPKLKVTNHREVTYRLLDFGDMIVYDEIEGLTGRPTSGILGMMFRIIGEGRVVQSRITLTPDGLQINRTHVKKGPFGVTETVTVKPDGVSQKGLPKDRPDLMTFATLLKRPFKIRYLPLAFERLAEVWADGWEGKLRTNSDFYEDKNHE